MLLLLEQLTEFQVRRPFGVELIEFQEQVKQLEVVQLLVPILWEGLQLVMVIK